MLKTILVLPDGRELSSGPGTVDAIQSCTVTETVNSGRELNFGSVCAAMAELSLITPQGGVPIAAGDELILYKDDGAVRHKVGIFIAEKPQRSSAHTLKLTAYDRVCKLDKDLTGWLTDLTGWPYSLSELAGLVCQACGLTLSTADIPSGSHLVEKFSAQGITGRRIMQWIGQAAGCFCRATAEGMIEFSWYSAAGESVGPTATGGEEPQISWKEGVLTITDPSWMASEAEGLLTVTAANLTAVESEGVLTLTATASNRHGYFLGSLRYEDYTVAPIERVQIRANERDIGTVYPQETGEKNTYILEGNPLLTAANAEALQTVAQTLFTRLQAVSYTPCSVTIPATLSVRAGQILSVTDRNGHSLTAYVMTSKLAGQKTVLECTGSPSRSSTTAVNEQSYQALSGKVLNLRTDVEGLRAENKAADGRSAALALTVDGLAAQVEKQRTEADTLRTQLTALEQTANAVKISVQTIQSQGVSKVTTDASYTFDDRGLRIAKSGQQMENLLDHRGMCVSRGGEGILQATADGVTARDVRVHNYLCVGSNARLEDYESGRTACFWIGG